jgi:hypothetical protein
MVIGIQRDYLCAGGVADEQNALRAECQMAGGFQGGLTGHHAVGGGGKR